MFGLLELLDDLWHLLPIILLLASGYIVYRILAVHKATDLIAAWFIRKSGGRTPVLLLYTLLGSTVLSFFISNTIAVLTILPIIKAIRNDYELLGFDRKQITTVLTLPLVYGANIGGMGSLIGGPAHLILLGSLEMMNVPGRENISFGTWFLWSLPMTVMFIVAAWLILVLMATPKRMMDTKVSLITSVGQFKLNGLQRHVFQVFLAFILFWSAQAIVFQGMVKSAMFERIIALAFFIVFFVFVVVNRDKSNEYKPLLKFRQLFSGVPPRLFLFLGLFIAVIVAVRLLAIDKHAVGVFSSLVSENATRFTVFLIVIATVMFLTEFFSNTIVATAFMPVAHSLALSTGVNPLAMMIAVSCACTCAYMTPIATPSNALAFAEMDKISLRKMMFYGLFMNIAGALIMSLYLPYGVEFIH